MGVLTQLAYREPKGVGLIEGPPGYQPLLFESPGENIRCCCYSPCGRYVAWALYERVLIVETDNCQPVTIIPTEHVFDLAFSPLGTFLATWQKPSKDEHGDAIKNLKVWRTHVEDANQLRDSNAFLASYVQKSSTGWNLQYTRNEQYCARAVTNEIQFFKTSDFSHVCDRLRLEGASDFAVSPGEEHTIAVFVPERKGLPATVKIFRFPQLDTPVSQKSFFKGDKVQLKWNSAGSHLLVLAQTEVDKSGKSYYGETTLYLMSTSGEFDSRVDLDKDGPIHDIAWSPNSKEFGVVYGYMPAKAVLFNSRAKASHTFPIGPRNTILFSPHGRFILVAGFGNLAGQMDIYDLEKGHTKVCMIEASNASLCEWCPDGIHILTATTSPRLRVDNGLKIWHVGGNLVYVQDMQELYDTKWRPQSPSDFEISSSIRGNITPHASASTYLGSVKTPQKAAGAYRPPGARGQLTPLAFRREDEGGAAYTSNGSLSQGLHTNAFGKGRRKEVPGAETVAGTVSDAVKPSADDETLSRAAAKNRKKREAKKVRDTTEKDVGSATRSAGINCTSPSPAHTDTKPSQSSASKSAKSMSTDSWVKPKDSQYQTSERDGSGSIITPIKHPDGGNELVHSAASPQDKKARALLKKLRAIDDLKMRRATGEPLEGTQIRKMETEDAIRRELSDLGYRE